MTKANLIINNLFTSILDENEIEFEYFYTKKSGNSLVIGFSNKRVVIIQIHDLSLQVMATSEIRLKDIQSITVKKGFIKTRIDIVSPNKSVKFKPKNICIGLPKQKENLNKLYELYKS